jgi:hypothetical protein
LAKIFKLYNQSKLEAKYIARANGQEQMQSDDPSEDRLWNLFRRAAEKKQQEEDNERERRERTTEEAKDKDQRTARDLNEATTTT